VARQHQREWVCWREEGLKTQYKATFFDEKAHGTFDYGMKQQDRYPEVAMYWPLLSVQHVLAPEP